MFSATLAVVRSGVGKSMLVGPRFAGSRARQIGVVPSRIWNSVAVALAFCTCIPVT